MYETGLERIAQPLFSFIDLTKQKLCSRKLEKVHENYPKLEESKEGIEMDGSQKRFLDEKEEVLGDGQIATGQDNTITTDLKDIKEKNEIPNSQDFFVPDLKIDEIEKPKVIFSNVRRIFAPPVDKGII